MLKTRRMLAAVLACIVNLTLLAACGRSEASVSDKSSATTTAVTTTVTTEETTETKTTETKVGKKSTKTEAKTTTTTADSTTTTDNNSGKNTTEESRTATTESPATQARNPQRTNPPATQSEVTSQRTNPPATDPPRTDPPVTQPPVTEPPVTQPPATQPPVTEPVITNPPSGFDPSTYAWPELDVDNEAADLVNFSHDGILYLDYLANRDSGFPYVSFDGTVARYTTDYSEFFIADPVATLDFSYGIDLICADAKHFACVFTPEELNSTDRVQVCIDGQVISVPRVIVIKAIAAVIGNHNLTDGYHMTWYYGFEMLN